MLQRLPGQILDPKIYISPNGKDYRTPGGISFRRVIRFMQKLGYQTVDIRQKYRHAHGILMKNGRLYHFKMASRKVIGELTHNEKNWNNLISGLSKGHRNRGVQVPKNISSGRIGRRYYLISEYYPGDFLAEKRKQEVLPDLNTALSRIVDFNIAIIRAGRQKQFTLPRDSGELGSLSDVKSFFVRTAKCLIRDLPEFGLSSLPRLIGELDAKCQRGLSHGDFVPWHMIKSERQIILIDGELASTKMPLFYDAAYFYERLYSETNCRALAKKYLRNLCTKLSPHERNEFQKTIRPLLAYRCLWGFWRAKNRCTKDFSSRISLAKDIIAGSIH